MRFKFPLQRILRLMEMREKSKKNEISLIIREISKLEAQKKRLEENINRILGDFQKNPDPNWAPYQSMKVQLDSSEVLAVGRKIQQEKVRLDEKKEALSQIMKQVKGLDSYRDKKFVEFRNEEQRRLQKQLDELNRCLSPFQTKV